MRRLNFINVPSGLNPDDVELCGELCRARLGDGLALEETLHAAGTVVPLHAHDRDVLLFVAEGRITDERSDSADVLQAGSLQFLPAGIPHCARVGAERARVFSVEIEPRWAAFANVPRGGPIEPIRLRSEHAVMYATALYHEFSNQDPEAPVVIGGLVTALLGEVARAYRTAPQFAAPAWLCEARRLLEVRALSNVRLSDIAAEVGVHPVHLSRAFHRHFGLKMSSFLLQHRIERARRALLASNEPVGTIGIEAGFCDHGHFTRAFRRYVNTSPSAYRARRRAIASAR